MNFISDSLNYQKPYILCLVTEIEGSAPGKPGFKMLVFPDGKTVGTVGGGDIERKTIQFASSLFHGTTTPQVQTFILNQKDESNNATRTAMICGGSSKIYFEHISNEQRLVLFGGGHIAQAIAPWAMALGYAVEICDNRLDYATKDKYPEKTIINIGDYQSLAQNVVVDNSTYCIIVTHGHTHDSLVLKTLLERTTLPNYIGMIGSKVKVTKIIQDMLEHKIPKDRLSKVYSPIGLSIGGETPAEIALGILAEIQAVKYGKKTIHMRD